MWWEKNFDNNTHQDCWLKWKIYAWWIVKSIDSNLDIWERPPALPVLCPQRQAGQLTDQRSKQWHYQWQQILGMAAEVVEVAMVIVELKEGNFSGIWCCLQLWQWVVRVESGGSHDCGRGIRGQQQQLQAPSTSTSTITASVIVHIDATTPLQIHHYHSLSILLIQPLDTKFCLTILKRIIEVKNPMSIWKSDILLFQQKDQSHYDY